MISYLPSAIKRLRPTAEFSILEDDYSTVKWSILEGKPPTQTEIDVAIAQIKADEVSTELQVQANKAALLAKLGITANEAKLLLS